MMLCVRTAIQGTLVHIKEPQSAVYVQRGTSMHMKEPQSAVYVQRGNGAQRELKSALVVRQGSGVRKEPPSVVSVKQVIYFSIFQFNTFLDFHKGLKSCNAVRSEHGAISLSQEHGVQRKRRNVRTALGEECLFLEQTVKLIALVRTLT